MAIAFRRIITPPFHRIVFTGQSVTVLAETIDASYNAVLLDTTQPPVISIFDPLGVQVRTDVDMVRQRKAVYAYTYHIPFDSPLGVYTANFTAISNEERARLHRIVVWKVILGGTASPFSYLVIRDQTHVPWYWYINTANQLTISADIPTHPFREGIPLSDDDIYWIETRNSENDIRYIRPNVTGVGQVVSVLPPVGQGVDEQLVFIGENGGDYILSLNITNQIVVEQL